MGKKKQKKAKAAAKKSARKVVKLTKEDLLAAARKHLYPERLRILAVGPPESLLRVLSGFGEVEEIKLEPEG